MLRLSWIPPPPTKCSPQPHLAAKEEHIMKISCNPEKDIKLSNNPNGSRLATVSITLDNSFVVRGLSVMNGSKGIFVNMPTDQNGDKKYVDTAFPTTKEMRDEISNVVIGAYSTLMKQLRANANANTNTGENTADNTQDFNAPSFDEPER